MFISKKLCHLLVTVCSLFLAAGMAIAQNVTVTGTVADQNGEPIIGATVMVKGTTTGVSTNLDGKYTISVPSSATLVYSAISYTNEEVAIKGRTKIDVVLREDAEMLGEATVTAEFGMKRVARSVGSAIQNVKATDIQESGRESFMNALQGRVAGMTVTTASGAPGASTSIVLRSVTSMSGDNSPLYIVDGVPINNTAFNSTEATGDEFSSRDLDFSSAASDLNPEDIESMTVLKGAAAAALYGSDASNGAIVITTKKGSAGRGKVSYSNNFRWDFAYGWPDLQTKYANGSYGTTNFYNTTRMGGLYPDGIKLYDNLKGVSQTGFLQQHNLSVEGGTEKVQVRASASYSNQKGVVKTTDYSRLNLALSGKAEITKWLNFEGSMSYANSDNHKAGNGTGSPLYAAYKWPMVSDINNYINPDGTMATPDYYTDTDLLNPLYGLYKNKRYDTRDSFKAAFTLNVKPTQHTFARVTMGWDIGNSTYQYYNHPYYVDSTSSSWGRGSMSQTLYGTKDTALNALAGYNNEWGKFSFSAQVGYHQREAYTESTYVYANKFEVVEFYGFANCDPESFNINQHHKTRRTQAISGQLEFGWNNMAFVTVRARNDWSSTLPVKNNHYFYPAVELSFVATELPFLKNLDAISYLKIRGAIARVGKDASPLSVKPALIATEQAGGGFRYGFTGPNESLRPEMTDSWEIGFEARLLNDRINVDFTHFWTRCSDQYVTDFRLSYATGFVLNNMNVGTFETKGWDLHIDGDVLRTQGGFRLNVGLNLDHSESLVTYLPEQVSEYYNAYTWNLGRNGIRVGSSLSNMTSYSYQTNKAGQHLIDPGTGNVLFTDTWDNIGDRQEKLSGSVPISASWKGFRLSALFYGRFGASIMNGTKYYLMNNAASWESVALREGGPVIFDGVLKNGAENSANPTPNNISVDYSIYGSSLPTLSYIAWFEKNVNSVRLQEVRLAYNIPSKKIKQWTRNFISAANIWVKGTDLAIWTNYSGLDPFGNFNSTSLGGYGGKGIDIWGIPNPRGLAFGIGLTF